MARLAVTLRDARGSNFERRPGSGDAISCALWDQNARAGWVARGETPVGARDAGGSKVLRFRGERNCGWSPAPGPTWLVDRFAEPALGLAANRASELIALVRAVGGIWTGPNFAL